MNFVSRKHSVENRLISCIANLENMKYSEQFVELLRITQRICAIIGIDILREDFKVTCRTVCLMLTIIVVNAFIFYTAFADPSPGEEYYKLFRVGAVIGTSIQGSAKAVCVLRNRDQFRFLYREIKGMYEQYEDNTSKAYKRVLEYNLSLAKNLLAAVFTIVTLACIGIITVPIFAFVFLDARIEILPYHIPLIDNDTDMGYYVTSISHIACVLLAGYGNLVCDSWLFVFVAHIPLMKNIMKCKFEELNEILEANPRDMSKSFGPLLDILKWHQKYNFYVSTIQSAFFWIIFVQIVTEFFSIASNIVCIFLGLWLPAPFAACYLYIMIYSYCVLGNLVETSNDEITTMIYDCCWHNMTVVEQKLILIMLRKSQNPLGLTIGGVASLSLNTALQLTKTIYTFSMMLKEFFN